MSTSTRVTRNKGKSDGLSLLEMLRPQRKPTNTENNDGDTILNTTFNAGSSQHHPQMPIHTSPFRSQSTPPQAGTVRMQETPVPAVPVAPQEPINPVFPFPHQQLLVHIYHSYLLLFLQKTGAVQPQRKNSKWMQK